MVILLGLFAVFSRYQKPASSPSVQNSVKTFELSIKDKKLVSGPSIIKVNHSDTVVLRVKSDDVEELHLHGYDKSVDLEKKKTSELKFTAALTGRFPFELEKSKTELGVLEVLPK